MRTASSLVVLLSLLTLASACSSPTSDGEGSSTRTEDVGTGEQALTDNEKTAFDFFVGKGLSEVQSAGIVGNLIQESNVLPGAVEPGGPGRGIAQWSTGGRWDASHDDNVAWYASTYGGATGSLTTQLDFIWYELETFSEFGLSKLKSTSSTSTATVAFMADYEICGSCAQSQRITYANQVLAAYGGSSGSSSSSSTSSSGSSGGETCYSSTLGKTMPENSCVQSRSNSLWYQCDAGSWVDRYGDPAACIATYPL